MPVQSRLREPYTNPVPPPPNAILVSVPKHDPRIPAVYLLDNEHLDSWHKRLDPSVDAAKHYLLAMDCRPQGCDAILDRVAEVTQSLNYDGTSQLIWRLPLLMLFRLH